MTHVYDDLRAQLDSALQENDNLRALLAELDAPPVVPSGWVVQDDGKGWGYLPTVPSFGPLTRAQRAHLLKCVVWAFEHSKRPPHEDDPIPYRLTTDEERRSMFDTLPVSVTSQQEGEQP